MFSLTTAFVTTLLATSALAAPSPFAKRVDVAAVDNGSCQAMFDRCLSKVKKDGAAKWAKNPFGFSDQCTIAAICYDTDPDRFLYDLYSTIPKGSRGYKRPYSSSSPRFTRKQYNRIVNSPLNKRGLEQRAIATQQNFVDFYYATLARGGGPYPDISYVIDLWQSISAWTGFCSSASIPYSNLADWFQYYASSNYSPSCSDAATTSAVVSTTSMSVVGGTTSVVGGTTTTNGGGTTTVVGGTTTVMGGTTVTVTGAATPTTVIGGTTFTVTSTAAPTTVTSVSTEPGVVVTTTDASGATITTTAPGIVTTLVSTQTAVPVTITTTATSTTSAAAATASNFEVLDAAGTPVGYLSTSGTITQDAEDALTPQAAAARKRQAGLLDLFSARASKFFCGIGGDLFGNNSYVKSGACSTSTGQSANHTATGSESTIFSISSSGTLTVFWTNNDGTSVLATLVMGTFSGVEQTLLFVLDVAATVFDGGVAGTPLIAVGHSADQAASTFSSFSTPASSASVDPSSAASSVSSAFSSIQSSLSSEAPVASTATSANISSIAPTSTSSDSSASDSSTSSSSASDSFSSMSSSSDSSTTSSTASDSSSSSMSSSSDSSSSTSSTAPSPTASVLAALNPDGTVAGYFSTSGTLTQDANDALAPQTAQTAPRKRWGQFFGKRQSGQVINLFSSSTNNYLCGQGDDLNSTNFVATGGCPDQTYIGQTHNATGYETAIFSIDNGALSALWINNDGTSINPVVFTYGTFQGVNNTLLFVLTADAPVFDNGASGVTVTAQAMAAPANDTDTTTTSSGPSSTSLAPTSSGASSSSVESSSSAASSSTTSNDTMSSTSSSTTSSTSNDTVPTTTSDTVSTTSTAVITSTSTDVVETTTSATVSTTSTEAATTTSTATVETTTSDTVSTTSTEAATTTSTDTETTTTSATVSTTSTDAATTTSTDTVETTTSDTVTTTSTDDATTTSTDTETTTTSATA